MTGSSREDSIVDDDKIIKPPVSRIAAPSAFHKNSKRRALSNIPIKVHASKYPQRVVGFKYEPERFMSNTDPSVAQSRPPAKTDDAPSPLPEHPAAARQDQPKDPFRGKTQIAIYLEQAAIRLATPAPCFGVTYAASILLLSFY